MRIAVVTPFPTVPGLSTGGVESVAECLVTSLRQLTGAPIDVLAPSFNGSKTVEQRDFGQVHWLPQTKPAFLGYWTLFRERLHQKLRELGPDIAHFQGYAGWALGYRRPSVVTIHGIPELDTRFSGKSGSRIRSLIVQGVESRARARDDAKIIISPYVSRVLGHNLGGRHWSIENPVHPDFFALHRAPASGSILYVGRISARKNICNLLRGFAHVAATVPDATLRLAGSADDPQFMAKCTALATDLGIAEHVSWLGNLSRQQLLREYERAAVLALVSYQETAPMAIAEAMAASLPVVASRVCGNPHMVTAGETGWLAEPNDPKDIADCLIRALDPQVNERIGSCARRHATARFESNIVASRTRDVYADVMVTASRGRP